MLLPMLFLSLGFMKYLLTRGNPLLGITSTSVASSIDSEYLYKAHCYSTHSNYRPLCINPYFASLSLTHSLSSLPLSLPPSLLPSFPHSLSFSSHLPPSSIPSTQRPSPHLSLLLTIRDPTKPYFSVVRPPSRRKQPQFPPKQLLRSFLHHRHKGTMASRHLTMLPSFLQQTDYCK